MRNLIRVSEIRNLPEPFPWKPSTCYKLKHLKRYPGLFLKLGGALFVDLNVLRDLLEEGRIK
jgi:hypothetical protein